MRSCGRREVVGNYYISCIKYLIYILVLIVGFSSCGKVDNLTAFSKRKYLKKPPKQKGVDQVIGSEKEYYAGIEIPPEIYVSDNSKELKYELHKENIESDKVNNNLKKIKPNKLQQPITIKENIANKQLLSIDPKPKIDKNNEPEVHPMAVVSFLCIVPGILLVIPTLFSLPLAIVSLSQINKNPDKYKGENWAIMSIILMGILILLIIIIAASGGWFSGL